MPNCIRTFTGKYVNLLNPDPETLCIEDIAHSLAGLIRWNAQTLERFSVSQHSLIGAALIDEKYKFDFLMHDASEAYLGDMSSPLKKLIPEYRRIQAVFERRIADKFGFEYPFPSKVHEVDQVLANTEWHTLMLENGKSFEVYSPQKAKVFFMKEFDKLKQ